MINFIAPPVLVTETTFQSRVGRVKQSTFKRLRRSHHGSGVVCFIFILFLYIFSSFHRPPFQVLYPSFLPFSLFLGNPLADALAFLFFCFFSFLDRTGYAADGSRLVAGVVAVSVDRRKVLVVESTNRANHWVLPKGGYETDEPRPEDAAARMHPLASVPHSKNALSHPQFYSIFFTFFLLFSFFFTFFTFFFFCSVVFALFILSVILRFLLFFSSLTTLLLQVRRGRRQA